MLSENKIKCPCGSNVTKSSLYRHNKTKKHTVYLETGESKTRTGSAEYQRVRFAQNPNLKKIQQDTCKEYYEENKNKIRERHRINREKRRSKL